MDAQQTERARDASVLVVDDDVTLRSMMQRRLSTLGYRVTTAESAPRARDLLDRETFDVALVDIKMPGTSGLDLLEHSQRAHPELPVVMLTASDRVEDAVEAWRRGAFDYLLKPARGEQLHTTIASALHQARLNRGRCAGPAEQGLIVASSRMQQVVDRARKAARSRAPVLLQGPSGSGKERLARFIHSVSPRADAPFVAVNCAALVDQLADAELFGHARGAFTGADHARVGLLEQAHGGTLFLDEVAELSLDTQAKLLRVLQERVVRPVMGEERPVDLRVVAATWQDLDEATAAGRFRHDLRYRLDVARLELPALAEQPEAVLPLAEHLLRSIAAEEGCTPSPLDDGARAALLAYPWPGNVRELENALRRAVIFGGPQLVAEDLGLPTAAVPSRPASSGAQGLEDALSALMGPAPGGEIPSLADLRQRTLRALEERYVSALLEQSGGNISEAARQAGFDRSNFRRLMQRVQAVQAVDPLPEQALSENT
jgi:DNA-binding NtrC family response regulator